MNKKHTMTKYGLLAVLAVVMVLCFSLSLAFTFGNVFAEGETTEPVPSTGETVTFHNHSDCTAEGDIVAQIVHDDGAIAGYDSLQNAIDEVKDGETVTLTKCVTGITSDIIINATGRSIILDLNGHDLYGCSNLDDSHTLTIVSGTVVVKNGIITAAYDNVGKTAMTYCIENHGNLTLENVTVHGGQYGDNYLSQGALIRNDGTLVINEGTIYNNIGATDVVENETHLYYSTAGYGIETSGGSVKLNNVAVTAAIGVYATGGSVEITGGTVITQVGVEGTVKAGGLWIEQDANVNVTIGESEFYVNEDVSIEGCLSDAVDALAGSTKNVYNIDDSAQRKTLTKYSFEPHSYSVEFVWADDNSSCVANYICENKQNCASNKQTYAIIATTITGDCSSGGTISYTASATFNDKVYTSEPVVVPYTEHIFGLVIDTPATKRTYKAFDKFDSTGLVLYKQCLSCGEERTIITDIAENQITYQNGNCFHYGDDCVFVTVYGLSCAVSGLKVNKYEGELTWQVSRDLEGAENNWKNIDEDESLVYDGGKWYFRAVFEDILNSENVIVVAVTQGEIKDAKDYLLIANVDDYADYEFDNAEYYVTIERQKINIADRELFGFELVLPDGTTDLWDGTVYIYETNEKEEYPSLSLLDLNDAKYTGWKLVDTRTVVSSIARDRNYANGGAMSIGVTTDNELNADNKMFSYSITNPSVANGVGVYSVSVRLIANVNYAFDTNYSSAIYSRGLTIDVSLDNKTAIVTKVWYVVQLDNWLVFADDTGKEYDLEGWVYGEDVNRPAPALAYGDIEDVSFELLDADRTPIGEVFTKNHFNDYINKSMPAGRYYLRVDIPDLTVDNITYKGATLLLGFKVEGANIGLNLTKNINTGYLAYEWQLTANREQFFAKFAQELAQNNNVVLTRVTPIGYWAKAAGGSNYTVTYNLSRMYSNSYYASNDNNILDAIKGGMNGTYTVYFQITAPNHNPLTAMNEDRYDYFFTVTVYEVLDTPTFDVGGLVYTGNKVQPQLTESNLYEVVWSNVDTYVNGGEHEIAFKLYDNVHYRWKENNTDTVTVKYTIDKAENEWIRVPNVVSWTFESFDSQVNRIRAVVKFLDNGQSIRFSVTNADETAIAGLTDFTVKEDGTINNAALIAALNALKAGSYKLVVTVDGTSNYNELKQTVDFKVGKTINRWADGEDDLVLPSWIVGQFDLEKNPIVVNSLHGEAIVQIRDIEGIVYYDSRNPENNKLNDLEVDKYLLYAWVEETDDFSALAERAFTIEVLKKIGLPWWGTTLVAVGALGLAAAVLLILWKLKVFEILTDKISLAITTRATVDATIAAVRATKRAEEAEAHKRKVEAAERLQAAREAYRNKSPEQKAQDLQSKAEATATKANEMHAKADKMRARADKINAKTEQAVDEQPEATEQPDDTSTEE